MLLTHVLMIFAVVNGVSSFVFLICWSFLVYVSSNIVTDQERENIVEQFFFKEQRRFFLVIA